MSENVAQSAALLGILGLLSAAAPALGTADRTAKTRRIMISLSRNLA